MSQQHVFDLIHDEKQLLNCIVKISVRVNLNTNPRKGWLKSGTAIIQIDTLSQLLDEYDPYGIRSRQTLYKLFLLSSKLSAGAEVIILNQDLEKIRTRSHNKQNNTYSETFVVVAPDIWKVANSVLNHPLLKPYKIKIELLAA